MIDLPLQPSQIRDEGGSGGDLFSLASIRISLVVMIPFPSSILSSSRLYFLLPVPDEAEAKLWPEVCGRLFFSFAEIICLLLFAVLDERVREKYRSRTRWRGPRSIGAQAHMMPTLTSRPAHRQAEAS
jgi:hypothetical protein